MFVFYKIVSVLNMRLDTLRNDIITYNRARARSRTGEMRCPVAFR